MGRSCCMTAIEPGGRAFRKRFVRCAPPPFVAECCDRVMVLENGRVRFEGALDEDVLQDSVAYLTS